MTLSQFSEFGLVAADENGIGEDDVSGAGFDAALGTDGEDGAD